jgi:glycosyltransferase involved in cell wall biosynthesis
MSLRAILSNLNYIFRMTLRRYDAQCRLRLNTNSISEKYFLSAVIRVKNEGRFLPELIAHQHLLGIEHFYIYDNNSTDDLAVAVAPFVERGIVTIVNWPPIPSSPSCYVHFFKEYAGESRWVAFLDADEYLIERTPRAIVNFLRSHASWPALAINWKYFGSSGHDKVPNGLILRNFVKCADGMSTHVKVIAQPRKIVAYYNSHNFVYRGLGFARDLDRRFVLGSMLNSPSGNERDIAINHYICRSRENYAGKLSIGFVDKEGFRLRHRRKEYLDAEFVRHNDVTDEFAARCYTGPVERLLRELGYTAPYVD